MLNMAAAIPVRSLESLCMNASCLFRIQIEVWLPVRISHPMDRAPA
jgi:hypothetical protein